VKGIIVIPKPYERRVINNQRLLFEMVRKEMGFGIQYTDNPSISSDVDVVMVFGVPQHNRPRFLVDYFKNLDRRIKLIGYVGDIQCYEGQKLCREEQKSLFERFDLILCGADEKFREWYPEYVDKFIFFLQFFAPHERYESLKSRGKKINQCLLIGHTKGNVYPLRQKIKEEGNPKQIKIIHAPGGHGKEAVIGNAYAKLLNSYACCVATPSKFDFQVGKHYEIPAAGSLLLAKDIKDLRMAGFEAYKHYVPITEDNVFSQIDIVLNNLNAFLEIKEKGMEFVRKNHSIRNRFDQLKEIMEEVCSG